MNILRMVNPVQAYAWGSKTFIQELLGTNDAKDKPQAELWMGAHPKSPSQILNGDILVNLDYIIAENPGNLLGSRIAHEYHNQLPFLLKVLAAEQPLSIQAHPDKKQAEEGFAKESKLGILIEAPERNYKDANHKPELLVALTPFTAFCGFRDYNELANLLLKYLPKAAMSELSIFTVNPNTQNLKELYSALYKAFPDNRKKLLEIYLSNVKTINPVTRQQQLIKEWALKLNELYPNDIGVLSPLLLNIIELKPMEGLYLEPGILHSYLHGTGMEIMANSDNVLRGGLTQKHIDIDELLNVADFTNNNAEPILAASISSAEKQFKTPPKEFALSVINQAKDTKTEIDASNSPEILFCFEGSFVIENCSQFLSLEKGQSLFVPFEVEGYAIQGQGTIFRAKVNL